MQCRKQLTNTENVENEAILNRLADELIRKTIEADMPREFQIAYSIFNCLQYKIYGFILLILVTYIDGRKKLHSGFDEMFRYSTLDGIQ